MNDPIVKRTQVVHVGTPPPNNDAAWETVEVHFHGFKDLPSGRNDEVVSPQFTCLGRQWALHLLPGGDEDSDEGYISTFLRHRSSGCVKVHYCFRIKKMSGTQLNGKGLGGDLIYQSVVDKSNTVYGEKNLARRSDILNFVRHPRGQVDAPLIIENILKRFNEEETSDVEFEVSRENERGDDSDGGTKKKARREAVHFFAHELVLRDSATTLAELAKSANNMTPIRINDVKPEVFHHLLYYVYGGSVSEEELEENAKDIIDAADKYGVVGLKLQAEAHYARSLELSVENVLDNLLYADSKNCALLKEMVVDFIAENGEDVLAKVSFDDVPGSVAKDLLTVMTRGKKTRGAEGSDCDGYETMRVSTLRRRLHEKGLDIDGSREAMIALLKENTEPCVGGRKS